MGRRKGKSGISETLDLDVPKSEEDNDDDEESEKGFFACYLLTSLSPRHKGHTYIGYTVNPKRRIRQHNGEIRNGAWRTKSKRPWEMVLCVYGFPTSVAALQFEWAWQHPRESLAVRKAATSFKSLSGVVNKIKLAYTMLTLPSWESLNLTVNYFSTKYTKHSVGCPTLPLRMKVQVRLMDELPCYAEGYESSCDKEDDWDNGEECDAANAAIISPREILTGPTAHNAACNHMSIDINPEQFEHIEDYGSRPGRESATLEEYCSQLYGSVRMASPIVTSFSAKQTAMEICLPRGKGHLQDSLTLVDSEEPFGSPSSVSCYSNKQETAEDRDMFRQVSGTTGEFGWTRENQLSDTVASEDKHPSTSGIASCQGEVIDLLTPSPDCRISSCSKKRRVPSVFPAIIDLTKSPIFVQL